LRGLLMLQVLVLVLHSKPRSQRDFRQLKGG
jgi:hypothetical protein